MPQMDSSAVESQQNLSLIVSQILERPLSDINIEHFWGYFDPKVGLFGSKFS